MYNGHQTKIVLRCLIILSKVLSVDRFVREASRHFPEVGEVVLKIVAEHYPTFYILRSRLILAAAAKVGLVDFAVGQHLGVAVPKPSDRAAIDTLKKVCKEKKKKRENFCVCGMS